MQTQAEKQPHDRNKCQSDWLVGWKAFAVELGFRSPDADPKSPAGKRRTLYWLQTGKIPARRVDHSWIGSRSKLRECLSKTEAEIKAEGATITLDDIYLDASEIDHAA